VLLFGLDRLKPGGWLIIEDIAEAALPVWQLVQGILPGSYRSNIIAAKKAFLFAVQRTSA